MLFIFLLFLFLFLLVIIKNFYPFTKKETLLEIRSNQIKFRDNVFKKKIEEIINNKAKVSSVLKIEILCKQAGYDYSYGEYLMLCIILAVIFPTTLMFVTYNIPLAIIVCILSFSLPKNILKKRRRKRKDIMDKQIGGFLDIITERYKHNPDLNSNICESLNSFKNQEPFYSELSKVVKLINYSGYSPIMALDELILSTGNKYLSQFKDSYLICQRLPSEDSRLSILNQPRDMYETDRKLMDEMTERLSSHVTTSYIVVSFIPAVMLYQCIMTKGYVHMLLYDPVGKYGLTFIIVLVVLTNWIIKNKINAPLNDD